MKMKRKCIFKDQYVYTAKQFVHLNIFFSKYSKNLCLLCYYIIFRLTSLLFTLSTVCLVMHCTYTSFNMTVSRKRTTYSDIASYENLQNTYDSITGRFPLWNEFDLIYMYLDYFLMIMLLDFLDFKLFIFLLQYLYN